MGELATAVQERLRDSLAAARPALAWETEYRVAGTPVDVAGAGADRLVLVELEWRRADPADNAAKLFRHLAGDRFAAERITVCQVFTGYYDLVNGGVSAKRENAEFVGRVAADAYEELAYHAVEFDLDPPKRGGDVPEDWPAIAGETAGRIAATIED